MTLPGLSRKHLLDLDNTVRDLEHKLQISVDPEARLRVAPGEGLKIALMAAVPPPSDLDPEPDVIAELPGSNSEFWWIARPEGTIVVGRPYVDKDPFCCECNTPILHLNLLGLYCRGWPICSNCASQYHHLLASIAALINSLGPIVGALGTWAPGVVASEREKIRDGSSSEEAEAIMQRPRGPVWLG